MRVVHLAAGAAGMYCGSCMHDNRLVAALRAQGHDVLLVPLYTPLRTDEDDVSVDALYLGGINVYLQQKSGFFRWTPRFLDRLWDARWLLRGVGRLAARTRPEDLGALTVSMLEGERGVLRKEVGRLVDGLRELRPSLVVLPNLMFVGLAATLGTAIGVRVLCTLSGEDIFLDRLPEPYRGHAFDLIAEGAKAVDGFVALTGYYAWHAARHFSLPAERVQQITMGIRTAEFGEAGAPPGEPFTFGYLARLCPEKGLGALCQAFMSLRRSGRRCRLRVAGYLGAADKAYAEGQWRELRRAGLRAGEFEYVGEVARMEKLRFLRSLHVLTVPATYAESKGFYVLEALAAGVPVVQPAHGAFPELVEATGGGLLYEPGDTQALAGRLAQLMDDAGLRQQLAERGRTAVRGRHTVERMAADAWAIYSGHRPADEPTPNEATAETRQ